MKSNTYRQTIEKQMVIPERFKKCYIFWASNLFTKHCPAYRVCLTKDATPEKIAKDILDVDIDSKGEESVFFDYEHNGIVQKICITRISEFEKIATRAQREEIADFLQSVNF
jgi:hypothetical protein